MHWEGECYKSLTAGDLNSTVNEARCIRYGYQSHHITPTTTSQSHLSTQLGKLNFNLELLITIHNLNYHPISFALQFWSLKEMSPMVSKSITELGVDDFVNVGVSPVEANHFKELLLSLSLSSGDDPAHTWRRIVSRRVLKPSYPHPLHQLIYYTIYSNHHSSSLLPLYWFPSM